MLTPARVERFSRLLLFSLALVFVAMLFAGRATAAIVPCDDSKGMPLMPNNMTDGMTTDLEVTGPCEVKGSASLPSLTYYFHSVNIYTAPGTLNGGSLTFDDALTDFYAENIVVEQGGSLVAGSTGTPIGTAGGLVTIHLWGAPSDPGVTCRSPNCGIPSPPMGTNPRTMNPATCKPSTLPGLVNDCFYDYDALDSSDRTSGNTGAYFGHKVLALSYGGTLQLFGAKGATYVPTALTGCNESSPSCTGTSWVRLNKNALPGDMTVQVAGAVDWQDNDNIVLTTTDYLPGHSEQLTIRGTPSASNNVTTINLATPVQYPHNGQTFDLSNTTFPGISRLGPNFPASAEMRAAVGLLSRSIRIISDGNTPGAPFTVAPGNPDNYFGGHTIVRQGFMLYQVQGAEFYQLGQGGAIMHYPVHFHMARQTPSATPPITFVKDSSVWDSMTRWIVIHATQGVRIARNVGYESVGHGYYLEDGTETGNQLYANLGAFARGAVANGLTPDKANPQNPRMVPGILTATAPPPPPNVCAKETPQNCPSGYSDGIPIYSDSQNPSVFWIMNGMNDFQYNLAAGAGTCGACYWFIPGAISGPSQTEKWFGYASEQRGIGRAGTTPLQNFVGNSCSSAMEGFVEVGAVNACNGVNQIDPTWLKNPNTNLVMLPSPQAPPTSDTTYWPITTGLRVPTRCSDADQGKTNPDCSTVKICSSGDESNCDVVVLNGFTTAFNWPEGNFAAVWLRSLWSLAVNSVVSDPQNAGINLVTSGGYDSASVFPGYWGLVRQTALIGSSQWQNSNNSALARNPYASSAGPFNPFAAKIGTGDTSDIKGLTCALDPISPNAPNNAYCLSQNDGVSFQVTNFGGFQRLFSVYDGPIFQDSNAYLDIHPTFLTTDGTAKGGVLDTKGGKCEPSGTAGNPCQFAGFTSAGVNGLRAYRPVDNNNMPLVEDNRCYEPNAAIGWKQPNGFYYAPAFHSVNLFFSGVDIRHFVTDPFFKPAPLSFATNEDETKKAYCFWSSTTFQGFTDIDRETVLNDDDGTLTGLTSPVGLPVPSSTPTPVNETISVNKADFFKAPTEAWECASDYPTHTATKYAPKCLPATAKTSPYEYVSTVIYPECAKGAPPPPMDGSPSFCPGQTTWGSVCTSSPPNFGCPGVQLYRQLLTMGEKDDPVTQLKRMMGQNNFQRSALTLNHGEYYINTTVSMKSVTDIGFQSPNVFAGGNVYDLFFLFTKPDTQQTYQLFVGKNIPKTGNKDFAATNVVFGYEGLTLPFNFTPAPSAEIPLGAWKADYDPDTGLLTLRTKLSRISGNYSLNTKVAANKQVSLGQQYCQPATMCSYSQSANRCQCNQNGPYASLCNQTNPAGQTVCDWSVQPFPLNCKNPNGCPAEFLDCPAPGCPAFQITFPAACADGQKEKCFLADDSNQRPKAAFFNSPNKNDPFNWNVDFNLEKSTVASPQCTYTKQPDTTASCPVVNR